MNHWPWDWFFTAVPDPNNPHERFIQLKVRAFTEKKALEKAFKKAEGIISTDAATVASGEVDPF